MITIEFGLVVCLVKGKQNKQNRKTKICEIDRIKKGLVGRKSEKVCVTCRIAAVYRKLEFERRKTFSIQIRYKKSFK